MGVEHIEQATAHRPWPLPSAPWVAFQSWSRTLFAHWPVPAAKLRDVVPRELTIEEHDGTAWLGVVPFRVSGSRPRGLPAFPAVSSFDEVNLRTYVRSGGYSGVWFFSLDASSALAAAAARSLLGLRYHAADIEVAERGDTTEFSSRRRDGSAVFSAEYSPRADASWQEAQPGTLEHFLIERYALFTVNGGTVSRLDIHHGPWRITRAEARITQNNIPAVEGVPLPGSTPLCHVAAPQHTLFWLPQPQHQQEQ